MDILEKIPIVEREEVLSKSFKMVIITGLIIVIIITCMYYQKNEYHNFVVPPPITNVKNIIRPKPIDKCALINTNNHNKPVLGKYIQLINLNKQIPVDKIAVINSNKEITQLYAKSYKPLKNHKGVIIEFELKKPIYIEQIVIDINMFDANSINIVTTQVKIKNEDHCLIWSYNQPLHYERYNYVYIVKPHIIYPVKAQSLTNPVLSDCEDELLLTQNLILNNWS